MKHYLVIAVVALAAVALASRIPGAKGLIFNA